MARIVCHASQLKYDDPRFEKESFSQTLCHECTLGILESVYHLVMQCLGGENSRIEMFNEIRLIDTSFDEKSRQTPREAFYWLMGKQTME